MKITADISKIFQTVLLDLNFILNILSKSSIQFA